MKDSGLAKKMEEEDERDWDRLHEDLGDQSKWKKAEGQELREVDSAVNDFREQHKRSGRPPADKPFKGIHINLPLDLLGEIRKRASKLNIGYQSYIKIALTKYLEKSEKDSEEH